MSVAAWGELLRSRICKSGALGGARVVLPEAGFSQPVFAAARHYVEKYGGRVALLDERRIREHVESEWFAATQNQVSWVDGGGDPVECGVNAIRQGKGDALVAGVATSSAWVISQAIRCRASSESWVSQGALLSFPSKRTIMIADCAVTPNPTAEHVAAIGQDMAQVFASLTGTPSAVALVSYLTATSGEGSPDKMAAAATMLRKRVPDLPVGGPIQLDAAVESSVAQIKGVPPPIGGSSNVLVFPCLDAANNVLKVSQWLGGADLICVVPAGSTRPIVNLSRGARVPEVVGTIGAVAALAT